MKLAYVFLISLLLVGCTTTCPQINCPSCNAPPPSTTDPGDILFLYFLDVAQGDATLIKHGETEMLIDCGKNGQGPNVVEFLEQRNVGDLEYLLITHPDSDHLGGCDDVLKSFKVHSVITNGEAHDTVSYDEVMAEIDTEQHIIATKGNVWAIGGAQFNVIQANNGLDDKNQNSIVAKLTYGSMDALFTGDCDKKCEDLLLDDDIDIEILKVAHHGTKYATDIDFLEKATPQIAVIQVGPNSYGHPSREALDRLNQEGVLIYRTDLDGYVTIRVNEDSSEVIV